LDEKITLNAEFGSESAFNGSRTILTSRSGISPNRFYPLVSAMDKH